ncbi:hypothetical protein CC1G_00574 [Coprinopsis cinerea okayama7|uniref:Uncharacterized protein n=1 Tax=Coprinopsis cinerea (strain Okayama-7 / 130 / ATCC MYA-4618 / FGSC 9003) TaxID=240176 RepID=A8N3W2_COPC7|nr:hypothetical protein CC1G_00574 [Coprinopsis cinerea okayama7\|eukprot:XP_001829395.1 hypothetical protein CC1G_00574 [Coprinopsis cinerea okayama7\
MSPPSSPTFGFFPATTTAPNAFSLFGQNPRDNHAMLSSLMMSTAGSPNSTAPSSKRSSMLSLKSKDSKLSLRTLFSKKSSESLGSQ